MTEPSLQEFLFRRIREKLPPDASLSDHIADLLHVSGDSAYRRIRGETPLILEEVRILCNAFDLSLDQLLELNDKSVVFSMVSLDSHQDSFENYLLGILAGLKSIASFSQKQVIYLSKDLPFFHNFQFRTLFTFRYFFWMKSILQDPRFAHRTFSADVLPPELEKIGREIIHTYNTIPSMEIWNTECINSTIAQIEYYREAGYFKTEEDVEAIYDSLRDTIDHIQKQAQSGCKFLPEEKPDLKKNNFDFFHNRIVLGDNTILALLNGKKTLYLNYDVLNYMSTTDEKFCEEVYQKIQTLMRRATILSNVSEKQRNIFFNILHRKIPRHMPSNAVSP